MRSLSIVVSFLFVIGLTSAMAQSSLFYPLLDNYEEVNSLHPQLAALANVDGETGTFIVFNVPETTCPTSFGVPGYTFADNAGLRFDNNGFIDCEYSLQFTFNVEDFGASSSWIRLFGFDPDKDDGIYIKLTDKPSSGTLDFWPNGLVGANNFFNGENLYQFVVTRLCSGLVRVYVNGLFFAEYDDGSDALYIPTAEDDLIDFFRDDTSVPNEASPGWVKNIIISNEAIIQEEVEEEWEMFCEVLQESDCAGVVDGTSILDDCGVCIQADDPNFNQSCKDCLGVVNGTAKVDECGECLNEDDPEFNMSCADCAGTPNGPAIIDSCGVCAIPDTGDFNKSCADCAGMPNGSAIIDSCGVCLLPDSPLFNQSCLDCAGIPNGGAIVDECNVCLQPDDPEYNQSCVIKFYVPTAFSPNEDGVNDVFEIYKSDDAPASIRTFEVYDKWGNKIFESRNFEFSDLSGYWDGRVDNNLLSSGVYVYVIDVLFENGSSRILTGDIAIVK